MTFDDLRTAYPDLALNLYALDPGGPVTLEVLADGDAFTFSAPTALQAIALAFPAPEPPAPVVPINAFD